MTTGEFKLTTKSQVTIPKNVKHVLRIGPGDSVFFKIEKGRVEIYPVEETKISIWDLGKKYRTTPQKRVGIQDMNRTIRKRQRKIAGWKR